MIKSTDLPDVSSQNFGISEIGRSVGWNWRDIGWTHGAATFGAALPPKPLKVAVTKRSGLKSCLQVAAPQGEDGQLSEFGDETGKWSASCALHKQGFV
jgi:hypothetical protein